MPVSNPLSPPSPDGRFDAGVVREAAQWLMRTHPAAEPSEAQWQACLRWRASHTQHELAWQHAQHISSQFGIIPVELSKATLGRPPARARRDAIKRLALLLALAPAVALTVRQLPITAWRAQYRTSVHERRRIMLADGSHIEVNAGSAFDAVYDETQRQIVLHEGEILIETAPDTQAAPRPFRVETADGFIRAIGTRFSVKRVSSWSDVAVFDGAVEVVARHDATQRRILTASQQVRLVTTHLAQTEALAEHSADWVHGILHANNQRLADFTAELARHRRGWIRCDPAVADLRISGSFRLDDTDSVLRALARTLPVQIVFHTRYWVTLQAA